jgi:glycosyltransferase involved in cell wall biosynthesis
VSIGPDGFSGPDVCVIGTVGRMATVKDQSTLARAFIALLSHHPSLRGHVRLVIAGDGPLRADCVRLFSEAGVTDEVWMPGERDDVPALMRGMDLFVLPSLAEGISNTILEAMATGLPVMATRVGGNAELVVEGETGTLVPPSDPEALAGALGSYVQDPKRVLREGLAGRARVEREFSLEVMVAQYASLYNQVREGTISCAE